VIRVWLIRHGASAVGVTDPPLSEEGRVQADEVATALRGRPLVRVISSDRRRALETAQMVAAPHGLAVEPTGLLRELDFGAWEGRSLADLWSEEPAAASACEADLRATPASFGETVDQLAHRVDVFWRSARRSRGGEVAIVAHAGSLAVLRSLITGEDLSSTFASRLEPGGAVELLAS
jgi:broad specificity phosphatase PhoE